MLEAVEIPPGPQGIAATVERLAGMVFSIPDQEFYRAAAVHVTRQAGNTRQDRAKAIYDFIRRRVRYVHDPHVYEHVTHPRKTLKRAFDNDPDNAEDCDGHAVVVAALCQSVGIPVRFVLTEDPEAPNPDPSDVPWWAHIHAEARTENGWIPLDTALGREPWNVPFNHAVHGRRCEIELEGFSPQSLGPITKRPKLAGLDPISSMIVAIKDIGVSLIQGDASKKVAAVEKQMQRESAEIQLKYAETVAELESEERRLQEERLALQAAEVAHGRALERARLVSLGVSVGVATLGLGIVIGTAYLGRKRSAA